MLQLVIVISAQHVYVQAFSVKVQAIINSKARQIPLHFYT